MSKQTYAVAVTVSKSGFVKVEAESADQAIQSVFKAEDFNHLTLAQAEVIEVKPRWANEIAPDTTHIDGVELAIVN